MRDIEGLADVVIGVVSRAMTPVLERLAVAEAKLTQYAAADQTIAELRERVVVAETKATLLVRPETGLDAFMIRLAAVETRLAAEREPDLTITRRLEALEQRPVPVPVTEDVNALRDRLVAVETKAGVFESQLAAPDPLSAAVEKTDRALAELSKDLGGMRERIAVVEVRPPVPGPKGEPGPPGKDGVDGKDGSAGLSYEGVYQEGQTYEKGMLVTWAGSSFHCNETTTSKPGESKAWQLMVKRGRDGKDFREAVAGPPPVVKVLPDFPPNRAVREGDRG